MLQCVYTHIVSYHSSNNQRSVFSYVVISNIRPISAMKSSVQLESFQGRDEAGIERGFIPLKLRPAMQQTSQEAERNAPSSYRG